MIRLSYLLVAAWCVAVLFSFVRYGIDPDGVISGSAAMYYSLLAVPLLTMLTVIAVACYGLRTRFGRALLLVGLGAVTWTSTDAFFVLVGTETYTSRHDIGYLLAPAYWGAALLVLWQAVGIDWHDVLAYLWVLGVILAGCAVLVLPFGADLLRLDEVSTTTAVVSLTRLLFDALLVHAAFVLWRRSYGFAPYRRLVIAAALLGVADVINAHQFATGTYDVVADPSDFVYATAFALLMIAITSFAQLGRAERRRRQLLMDLIAEHQRDEQTGGAPNDAAGPVTPA